MMFCNARVLTKTFSNRPAVRRNIASSRDKKSVTIKLVDMFQAQLRNNNSDARVKMHGDVPFAAPWWAWLMR
jgi:hypothetical protein